jgi:CRP-like cAMP-binding protein
MTIPDAAARLGRFWIFDDLSPDELAACGDYFEQQTVTYGTILFRQGDPPDHFYLVEEGLIEEIGRDAGGVVTLRRKSEAGDSVGHRSLVEGTRRDSTATIREHAYLLSITLADFQKLVAMFPLLRERLKRTSVVNRLLAIPLFASFSQDQLLHVADLARVVQYPAGETIFSQGEPADALYVIDSGQIVEGVTGASPSTQTWPRYLSAGSCFGRYGLLYATTRRATAEAATDAQLFRFGADAFQWLCQVQPDFKDALKRPNVVQYLGQTELFAALDDEELQALAGYVGVAHLRPRDVLYTQGEVDPTFYILYEGEAIIRGRDDDGRERPRGYLQAGDSVGESSLFLRESRDVTVEATTNTNWFYLTAEDLDQFLELYPDVWETLLIKDGIEARRKLRRFRWMEPDEQLVFRSRRHWFYLLTTLILPGLALAAALVVFPLMPVPALGFLAVALAVSWIIWRAIDWGNDFYIVTTRRVAHLEKLLFVREGLDETPLDKIQNINIYKRFLGNVFGFGNLVIDTAAAAEAGRVIFTYVALPERIQAMVLDQMNRARAGERWKTRRAIRDRLEATVGAGIYPTVPKPALPPLFSTPLPNGSGTYDETGGFGSRWPLWTERRTEDQITWRKHWIRLIRKTLLPTLLLLPALAALILYLAGAREMDEVLILPIALLLLVAAFWWWWGFTDWGNDLYIVTDDRIIDTDRLPLGFRSSRTETMFDRIQNISYEIPNPVATLLNYGTVFAHTAGAVGRLDFLYVGDPRKVQAEIFRRLTAYEATQRHQQQEQQRDELSEWFAVYDQTQRP